MPSFSAAATAAAAAAAPSAPSPPPSAAPSIAPTTPPPQAPPAPSTESSARALIRRLRSSSASLLPPTLRPGARRRTVADFHLRLDDPHRVYSPTDVVAGHALVTLERPLTLTHLTVSLVGCVSVCTPAPREPGRRSKRCNREGWGNAAASHHPQGRPTAASGAAAAGFGTFYTCWDEAVLCGAGRLEPGPYRFAFQLEFRRLPGIAGLPTSLDFEKGSISYTVVATMTRPAANPTISCSTRISLMDTIDIARYPPPKPRIIKLEPVSRHRPSKRVAAPHRSPSPSPSAAAAAGATARRGSCCSTPSSSTGHLPASFAGTASSIPAAISTAASTATLPHPSGDGGSWKQHHKKSKGPIIAVVELLNSGALRGENVAVKITIQHTKRIKSLHGIIITLMRQTRFDPFGNIDDPDGPDDWGDVMGKLKMGIASTFRKDLSQTICPILLDPDSLTAVVRATLRVPEDAFPTITNVPGGAVEFRYWVEVVMDLGGKLDHRSDLFCAATPVFPTPTSLKGGDLLLLKAAAGAGALGAGRALDGMVETEHVRRREKSVVACKFEVVVGTVDSVGRKGRLRPAAIPPPQPPPPPPPHVPEAPQYDPRWQHQQHQPHHSHHHHSHHHSHHQHHHGGAGGPLHWQQPPPVDDIPPADEKMRLRLAEERLLPSAPANGGPSSSSLPPPPPPSSSAAPSAPPLEALTSAPPPELMMPVAGEIDKAELERRRLLAEESAPPPAPSPGPGPGLGVAMGTERGESSYMGAARGSGRGGQHRSRSMPRARPSAPLELEFDDSLPPEYHR